MENSIDAIIFSIVFRYLSDYELHNASKVCRIWWRLAKNENILRGPMYIKYTGKPSDNRKNWLREKQEIIMWHEARPCLQIFFSNVNKDKNDVNECHCEFLSSDSYTIDLGNNYRMDERKMETILMSLTFPKTYKTKIATYTFINDNIDKGLFCQEIRFHCGTNIKKIKFLKTHMQSYFQNDSHMPSCMLLFSRESSIFQLVDLIFTLAEWFPKSNINIWGGIINSITVCQQCFKKSCCRVIANCTLILISNPKLAVWTEILDHFCNTREIIREKLINLKKKISLNTHTVALINTAFHRKDNFYALENSIFREIFPGVTLFHMYGNAAFRGEGLQNDHRLSEYSSKSIKNIRMFYQTSIMIITYD